MFRTTAMLTCILGARVCYSTVNVKRMVARLEKSGAHDRRVQELIEGYFPKRPEQSVEDDYELANAIIRAIQGMGYDVGEFIANGAFKNVIEVKKRRKSYVVKISIGKVPVGAHEQEIERQREHARLIPFILQSTEFFHVDGFDACVEIQEIGQCVADEMGRGNDDYFNEGLELLRKQIEVAGFRIVDFNPKNVALFDGDMKVIDLGAVVRAPKKLTIKIVDCKCKDGYVKRKNGRWITCGACGGDGYRERNVPLVD